MIWFWARALRSMVARPCEISSTVGEVAPEHLGPAEDGVERGAQFVGERGQELVLHAAHALGFHAGGALAVEELGVLFEEGALVVDVRAGAVPAGDVPGTVADGQGADEEPAGTRRRRAARGIRWRRERRW